MYSYRNTIAHLNIIRRAIYCSTATTLLPGMGMQKVCFWVAGNGIYDSGVGMSFIAPE